MNCAIQLNYIILNYSKTANKSLSIEATNLTLKTSLTFMEVLIEYTTCCFLDNTETSHRCGCAVFILGLNKWKWKTSTECIVLNQHK